MRRAFAVAAGHRGAGPVVLNGRVTARPEVSGVERFAAEVIGRLCSLYPDCYRMLRPAADRAGGKGDQGWEQFRLPLLARRLGASLIYSPANLAPLAWPHNVLVLHDAAVWRYPESFSRVYVQWHRRLEAISARRALRVITVSDFSRRELSELIGLDAADISVIPNGVAESFNPQVDPAPARHRHGLQRPYVLTVATADRRKNLELLSFAARGLASEGVDVAWVGGGRDYLPGTSAIPGVRALGYVDDQSLAGLYVGAAAFVMPSLYEGFGLPCLEAMACGTPVVAANAGALPETCADAALLADPADATAFLEAVMRVLARPTERAVLVAAGLRRAAQFTWERTANATHALLSREAQQIAELHS